ncbi:MAG: beta-xylosidase, partial [Saprospiraceae bacterium]|nr:beta-xylosidase [Saprospiraceae bacterium]
SVVLMNLGTQLRDISKGFEVVASYPDLKDLPIVIGESDPEGCAACSVADYPANDYRNGTLYSSYTAAAFSRKFDLADHFGINLHGVVTWAFEFEDQPWFHGYRELATNGVDKPVLNIFRMFGKMEGDRVEVSGNLAYDFLLVRDSSVRGSRADINALATKDIDQAAVMLWNYHDLNIIQPAVDVRLVIKGLEAGQVQLRHYRVDQEHSNSFEVWKKMGSPQIVTPEQYQTLEAAGKLKMMGPPAEVTASDGQLTLNISMEGQAVSLLLVSWGQ